jgi:serine/threonine protein kinase
LLIRRSSKSFFITYFKNREVERGKSNMSLETLKNNRYRIVRPLGSGSTGEVYLVEDNLNNRQEVVLKLLHAYAYPATLDAQNAPHFFEFEARAIAQLNHPNILPLLDYSTELIDGSVVPYIVTPNCPEGSLATWLEQRSDSDVLTLEDAARIVRQIADALQYAHNQGVIHRDVKSANVFIRNKLNGPPDMLVADFGFAQPIPGAQASGFDVRGTPDYMAPEQWEGQVVPASDQYALGVLIYQLLTGRLPFQGSVEQLRDEHHNSWPSPPSTINPTLSRDLDVVVGKALAKKPGDRYPTVSAFADAFSQAILPAPVPAPVYLAAPPTPPENINVGNVTVTPPPPAPARRMSTGMIVLISVLALLVVLGGIAFAVNASSNNSAQTSTNATATANTNNATTTGQANGNTNSTATSQANTTATANTNATATAQTNGNATATAGANSNANANATATAKANTNANANATATAQANANATATVAPAAALSGNWVNPNATNPQVITKMTITNNGTNVSVHPFSNYPTANCDWGTKSSQYTGSPLNIVFVVNCGVSSTESLAISLQGAELKVVDNSSTIGNHTFLLNNG